MGVVEPDKAEVSGSTVVPPETRRALRRDENRESRVTEPRSELHRLILLTEAAADPVSFMKDVLSRIDGELILNKRMAWETPEDAWEMMEGPELLRVYGSRFDSDSSMIEPIVYLATKIGKIWNDWGTFSERSGVFAFLTSNAEKISSYIVSYHASNWHRRPHTWTLNGLTDMSWYARFADITKLAPGVFVREDVRKVIFAHRLYRNSICTFVPPRPEFTVSRETVLVDSVESLNGYARKLRLPIERVRFQTEAAFGEGVIRDWFTEMARQMFNPEFGLFKLRENDEPRYLEVSPQQVHPPESEKLYRAVGRFLALTITQGNPIRVNFPVMFYARLLGTNISSLEDIAEDEPKLFDSLDYVRKAEQAGLDGLELDSPDGTVVPLTVANRDALILHRINTLISPKALPFIDIIREGFNDVIPLDLIRDLFSPIEFGGLIVGKSDFTVEEFVQHVRLTGYTHESDQIKWLIKLLRDFTAEQRAKFLRFVTSSTQLPSVGFAGLSKPFAVSMAQGSTDLLPTSQTCFNKFNLPQYPNEETLRAKVSIAIEADSGMGST
jgi:hypothetical protein